VPGSSSDVYAPPLPGASAIIATCASIVATASEVERKTWRPISNASTRASGTRMLDSWRTTALGSTPATFEINASQACQSGNA
jgi:hypothetical protein